MQAQTALLAGQERESSRQAAYNDWVCGELEKRAALPQKLRTHEEVMQRLRERIALWEAKHQ